jgi:membrane protease YdiL (CAAX protease family)
MNNERVGNEGPYLADEIPERSGAIGSPMPVIDRRPIAPLWHTVLLVLLIAGTSWLGTRHTSSGGLRRAHLETYLLTLLWEWALAGFTFWGLRLRETSLRKLVGEWRSGFRGWMIDLGGALLFWIMAMTVLVAVGVLLRLGHMENAQKKLAELAPQSLAEMGLWIILSCSAGICEEFVFRGYLQQQFSRMSGRVWVGVIASSLLFGAAHGYEGLSGMIAITLFGAMFSMLAIRSRGLKMGMIAHAWHDAFTGAVLALAKMMHAL